MPISPERKILDLIIEAAEKACLNNLRVQAPHFQDFVCELAAIRASLSKDVGVIEAVKPHLKDAAKEVSEEHEQLVAHLPQETGGEEWWNKYIHDEPFSGRATKPHRMVLPSEIKEIVSLAEALKRDRGVSIRRLQEHKVRSSKG